MLISNDCDHSYRLIECLIRFDSGLDRVLISKPANFVTLVEHSRSKR